MPTRVQRSRQKKLPPNTKCCTRPGKWGNPFTVPEGATDGEFEVILGRYADELDRRLALPERGYSRERLDLDWLRGYDHLACWCPLNRACHVDIILNRYHAYIETEET